MTRIIILLLFSFILQNSVIKAEDSTKYTIEDLHVLESEKNYQEFIAHAHDIRPSKRDKVWKEMTIHMATKLVEEMSKQKDFKQTDFNKILDLQNWPLLKNDEVFVSYRNSYGEKFLAKCFSNTKKDSEKEKLSCLHQLERFWDSTPMRSRFPGLGINLAVLANKHYPQYDLMPLIKMSIISPMSEFYCTKAPIKTAIFKEVSTFLQTSKTEKETKSFVDDLLGESCKEIFLKNLKELLYVRSLQSRQVAYQVLSSQKALSAEETDLYLTLYILRGPATGDTFNHAWATVTKLGQDFFRRSKVIKQLKTIDPLPDELFSMPDLKKTKVLIQLLQDNMPEYVDHYANTCLSFLEGLKAFPNGNPTVACRDFFKTYQTIVPAENQMVNKYNKIIPL